MRIVNKAEFYQLPVNTWYYELDADESFNNGTWMIKGETIYSLRAGSRAQPTIPFDLYLESVSPTEKEPIDYYEFNIGELASFGSNDLFDQWDDMLEKGWSVPLEHIGQRNAMFDADTRYVVLEKNDLLILQELIAKAVAVAAPIPNMLAEQRQKLQQYFLEYAKYSSHAQQTIDEEKNLDRKLAMQEALDATKPD